MVDKARMCRHLPEWFLRQYGYVQAIPRPPTKIAELLPEDVVMAFMEFVVHVLSQQKMGDPVLEDEVWKHSVGYMKWFYNVSYPIMIVVAAVADYTALNTMG